MSGDLPGEVTFQGDAWTLCFDSRGIASAQMIITMKDGDGAYRQLEIMRGGILRTIQ